MRQSIALVASFAATLTAAGGAQAQGPTPPASRSTESQAAFDQAQSVSRKFFERLKAGQIAQSEAPSKIAILMGDKIVFASVDALKRTLANCELSAFFEASFFQGSPFAWAGYSTDWRCQYESQKYYVKVGFKIVDGRIDEVGVTSVMS